MSLLFQKLCKRIEACSEACEGVIGIGLKDLSTGAAFYLNSDELFPVASTIKVPILIELYKRVEDTSLSLSQPIKYEEAQRTGGSGVLKGLTPEAVTMPLTDWATLMITVSDNTATNLIIDILGMDRVNETLSHIGLKVTRLARKMMDMEAFRAGKDSITTPRELIALFEELHNPVKLSRFVCEETLEVLKMPKEAQLQGVIRNSVPDSVEVADKSGWVSGSMLDAGIVYQPRKPYAVALLVKHIPVSDLHGVRAYHALTKVSSLINSYFEEVSASTPHGRKL